MRSAGSAAAAFPPPSSSTAAFARATTDPATGALGRCTPAALRATAALLDEAPVPLETSALVVHSVCAPAWVTKSVMRPSSSDQRPSPSG